MKRFWPAAFAAGMLTAAPAHALDIRVDPAPLYVFDQANERNTYDLVLQNILVVNNERLLAGENQRFSAGESSLFLVNAREVPLIDARIRQVDLEARLRKAYFALDHEAGTLWQAWRR